MIKKLGRRLGIFVITLSVFFNALIIPVHADTSVPNGIMGTVLVWLCANGITFGSGTIETLKSIIETAYGGYIAASSVVGLTADQIQNGITARDNKITIDSTVSNWCNGFWQWIISEKSLNNGLNSDVSFATSNTSSNDLFITDGSSFSSNTGTITINKSSSPIFGYVYNVNQWYFQCYFFSLSEFYVQNSSGTLIINVNSGLAETTYSLKSNDYTGLPINNTSLYSYTHTDRLNFANSYTPDLPLVDMNLNITDSGLNDVILGDNQSLVLEDVSAQLKTLIADLENAIDIDQAVTDQIADDVKEQPVDPTLPTTYPLYDVQDITKVIDNTTITDPTDTDMAQYKLIGLSSVFPFCIPFDLYYLVKRLSADPVTPSFPFSLHISGVVDYDQTLDLSSWNDVALVFRAGETLVFIGGLIFVTRELIRG